MTARIFFRYQPAGSPSDESIDERIQRSSAQATRAPRSSQWEAASVRRKRSAIHKRQAREGSVSPVHQCLSDDFRSVCQFSLQTKTSSSPQSLYQVEYLSLAPRPYRVCAAPWPDLNGRPATEDSMHRSARPRHLAETTGPCPPLGQVCMIGPWSLGGLAQHRLRRMETSHPLSCPGSLSRSAREPYSQASNLGRQDSRGNGRAAQHGNNLSQKVRAESREMLTVVRCCAGDYSPIMDGVWRVE